MLHHREHYQTLLQLRYYEAHNMHSASWQKYLDRFFALLRMTDIRHPFTSFRTGLSEAKDLKLRRNFRRAAIASANPIYKFKNPNTVALECAVNIKQ
jgi:hypothetical protein